MVYVTINQHLINLFPSMHSSLFHYYSYTDMIILDLNHSTYKCILQLSQFPHEQEQTEYSDCLHHTFFGSKGTAQHYVNTTMTTQFQPNKTDYNYYINTLCGCRCRCHSAIYIVLITL